MSATDTSQPSSDFLKSPRLPGDFELNSWTQGLGGAPRPNPIPQSAVSAHTQHQSTQSSLSFSADANRYSQSGPSLRQDPKISNSSPINTSNPFISSSSLGSSASIGQTTENRPDSRGVLRDAWSQAQTSDLQSFDLSTYVQSQSRPSATTPTRDFAQAKPEHSLSSRGFNDWGHQASASVDNSSHQAGYDQLSSTNTTSNAGEFDEFDTDSFSGGYESRFASKKILLSTILIGALILGGGASYLYNSFFGNDSEGPTPVVKNAQGPAKVKPTEPGGKQFAHADSKILGRLNDPSSSSDADQSSGTRKVSTLVVGRDGAIQAPSGSESDSPSSSVSVPVPGMTLIDTAGSGGKSTASTSEVSTASTGPSSKAQTTVSEGSTSSGDKGSDPNLAKVTDQPPQNTSANSPQEPSVAAPSNTTSSGSSNSTLSLNKPLDSSQQSKTNSGISNSTTEGSTKSTLTETDLAQPSQSRMETGGAQQAPSGASLASKSKTELKTAALESAPKASRSQSVPVSGLGYVAVLASVPVSANSRIVALQQYADLQQKYNGILQNKTPDVQEANLGEKGRYHRLIIGPPGSKDAANATCAQLKSAGYSGCWIMAY